jgi:UDP-GlcNAc:undecaprenyl-phosphate GlcNAc-1-phosphate transferase
VSAVVLAFVVAVVATPVAAAIASRLGVVDHPGPLKPQQRAVPYLGGLAVMAGVAGPLALERPSVLVPLGLACLLGLADDLSDVSPPLRLGFEIVVGVAAAAVVPGRGVAGALLTIAFVLVLLNAVNLLDGLDGLAAGVALTSAAGFAVLLTGDARTGALALGGALAGFLLWNRPPARIYLGDAGSYLVGTGLAMLLAVAFADGEAVATSSAALLLVAVPVADTAIAIVRRARARRPLFGGDRGHVYDQLVDRGWRVSRVVVACIAAQAALAVLAIAVAELPAAVAVCVVALVVMAVGGAALVLFTQPGAWSADPGRAVDD